MKQRLVKYLKWLKENWRRIRFSHVCYCLILYFIFGEIQYRYQKYHLEKLSPKTIAMLFEKAMYWNDCDLLERIIHPAHSDFTINRNPPLWQKGEEFAAKVFGIIVGAKRKVCYQKILDSNTAEVGFVHYSIYRPFMKEPSGQYIFKKHNNIWKYFGDKWVSGKMLEELRKNPTDLSLYYYCGQDMANNQDRVLSYRFRKKYYELDPAGFWVTKSFLERLKAEEKQYETDHENYEKQLLSEITHERRSTISDARNFITLTRISMLHRDIQKAEQYLNEAENTLKQDSSELRYFKDALWQVTQELRLQKEGKYFDLLDELDRLRKEHKSMNNNK